MDKYLIDYLSSGKAWVLVGSGPSRQMGYPPWAELARRTVEWVRTELLSADTRVLDGSLAREDWPAVFGEASRLLGDQARLLQFLENELKPNASRGEVYDLIARWPVPVYLTTNWDDEIQKHLTKLGETYLAYTNSADHMSRLVPDLQGAIVKLHGDLRSATGLVMTSAEYDAVGNGAEWEHWRSKMNAVFQMNRVVVVGHSLSDPHIRLILAAAKRAAGIHQPVVWLAPDADDDMRREMLAEHRIRVVPYINRDGSHTDLLRLLRDITRLVVPRERIAIQQEMERALPSVSQSESAAAAALFVYSKVAESDPLEKKRTKLIVAALESAVPELASRPSFTLVEALAVAGWPDDCPLGPRSAAEVLVEAQSQGLMAPAASGGFTIPADAVRRVRAHVQSYSHLRERFGSAVAQRATGLFPSLSTEEAARLAADIDRALIGGFRADGFALAAATFGTTAHGGRVLPRSVVDFLNSASAQYHDLLHRRAFFSTVVDMLVNATSAETQYLGALVGGYCAFSYLGVYGDVAIQRLQHAKDTVWLVDSDVQIPALALVASSHLVFASCLRRLRDAGIRLFTLDTLFEETYRHYWFARGVISRHGPASPEVLYAAQGQPPYRMSNQFLEGFIRWQAGGNPPDWERYLFSAFGDRTPDRRAVRSKLEGLGVAVVDLQDWPGFDQLMFGKRDELTKQVTDLRRKELSRENPELADPGPPDAADRKARPEAEAVLVVQEERNGNLHALSDVHRPSDAWFVSHTSILDALCSSGPRITWRPESFLRFTEGLASTDSAGSTERAERIFQTLLWSFAQSGLSLLGDKAVEAVFGPVAEECVVTVSQARTRYAAGLSAKYGPAPDDVLKRMPVADRPQAATQLANELAQAEAERADGLAQAKLGLEKENRKLKSELAELDGLRRRLAERKEKSRRNKRKGQAGGKR